VFNSEKECVSLWLGDVETNFLIQIEEEFEDQLNCHVELVDMINFDLHLCLA